MSHLNRKVVYLSLHQNLFIPGPGDLGKIVPSQNKTFGCEMVSVPEGVLIKVDLRGKHEALVPWGNIVLAKFADV